MTRTLATTLAAALLLPLSGCMAPMMAAHAMPPAAAGPAGVGGAATMQMCPMAVPGAQVSASDTAGGEALTFTTATGDVGELRNRARAMAQMHDHHHGMGGGMQHMGGGMGHGGAMTGMMGGGSTAGGHGAGGHGSHAMAIPPSNAALEDVESGARIVFTPDDPADLEVLRSAVRMHAEQMQQHGCAMMGDM